MHSFPCQWRTVQIQHHLSYGFSDISIALLCWFLFTFKTRSHGSNSFATAIVFFILNKVFVNLGSRDTADIINGFSINWPLYLSMEFCKHFDKSIWCLVCCAFSDSSQCETMNHRNQTKLKYLFAFLSYQKMNIPEYQLFLQHPTIFPLTNYERFVALEQQWMFRQIPCIWVVSSTKMVSEISLYENNEMKYWKKHCLRSIV